MDAVLRERLSRPFGPVLGFDEAAARLARRRPPKVVAVGDQIVMNLLRADLKPDVAVVDLACQRHPVPREWERAMREAASRGMDRAVPNPAGTVHPRMEQALRTLLADGSGWLLIEGEDDLCSLVVMAAAPPQTLLLYGQPNLGVVWVEIEPGIQKTAQELLAKLKKK